MSARKRSRTTRHFPSAGATALEINVAWRGCRDAGAIDTLSRTAASVARAERFRTGFLSIAVVGRKRMAQLHVDFSGISGATDVLTFDLGSDPRRGRVDGEIVVCVDEARRQAGRLANQQRVLSELVLYVTHGILHLAGYDDRDAAEFERMHAREDALLSRLGFGRVFARSP